MIKKIKSADIEIVNSLKNCIFLWLGFCLFLSSCQADIVGDFGWARTDDRGIREPERSLLLASEFRFARENLYFYDYETIWWTYQIDSGFYDNDKFLAALYENNDTPDPVLFELRRVLISHNDCCDIIRQKYENLKPGHYLLKIAYESKTFDHVGFYVLPPEGPIGLKKRDDLDEEFLEYDNSQIDDIELYSR